MSDLYSFHPERMGQREHIYNLIRTCFFRGRTIDKCHLGVKEKEPQCGIRLDCSSEIVHPVKSSEEGRKAAFSRVKEYRLE